MRRGLITQLVFSSLLSLGAFFTLTSPVRAGINDWFGEHNDTQKNSDETVKAVVDGEKGKANKKHFDDGTLQNVQSSGVNYILGASEESTSGMSPEEKRIVYERYGRGAIGSVTDSIVALYTPPASARTYVADLLHSAHLIPQAQAQGLGFASLDPILQIWKIFRNLAYLVFVIIFIVIGFMIMFRQKIGQTAVTVQQAIPNIIVSLIFVTFSYAIAGFMIDLMYVLMYLLVGMFSSDAKAYDIMNYSFINLGLSVLTNEGNNTGAFSAVFNNVNKIVEQAVNIEGLDKIIGGIASLTAAIIMAVAILISVFKLFFELLKTYITIVLSIAFAPLVLMMGALPGRNAFQTWIVNLAGNLLAFPTVLLAVIVFRMFANAGAGIDTGGFLPPFLIGRGVSGTITTLVGVGIILIMPELVAEMKKAVGVKGGIFEQLGKAMVTNFRRGEKAGLNIMTAGTAVGAGGLGAGVGALGGAVMGARNGGNWDGGWKGAMAGAGRGARTGLIAGAATPVVARALPNFVRGTVKTIGSQIQDIGSKRTVKKVDEWRKKRAADESAKKEASVLAAEQTAGQKPPEFNQPKTPDDALDQDARI